MHSRFQNMKILMGIRYQNIKILMERNFFIELVYIQDLLEKSMGPTDIVNYLTKRPYLPVATIAYIILLTIPVLSRLHQRKGAFSNSSC
jgi:hypothetical protein